MNIVLADDESLVRAGLRSMLNELNMPLQVVGEARNGEEAVRLIEEQRPDVAFVDIRMPKLSGLDVIAHGKTVSPLTKWIILSGYSEFQYAKEALRLGACNYLLKPVSLQELKDSVVQANEALRQHMIERNGRFEHALVSWMQGRTPLHEANHLLASVHCKGLAFYIDSCLPERELADFQHRLINELQSMIRDRFLSGEFHSFAIALNEGHPAIIWAWHPSGRRRAEERERQLEQAVRQWLEQVPGTQFAVTAIELEECAGLESMAEQIGRLQTVASLRSMLSLNATYRLSGLTALASHEEWLRIGARLENVCRSYRHRNYPAYAREVDLLEKEMNEIGTLDRKALCRIQEFLAYSLGVAYPSGELADWFKTLQHHGDSMLSSAASQSDNEQKDIVQCVIAYVDQNYMHDIGIKQIAELLHVTPNYLSTLFHKKHGSTFIKYLTETRMLKAKELLLKEPDLKVRQVAEAVGYYSTRHFTKLFTEQFGCYPSECRDKKNRQEGSS
ncbi:response regulator [Paenibacillus sp. MSJ-34]|uniref:response regulator transcription factor n=1 Tax=Paenibacillus sp. MSJ-34 TaxID=2841529 RepID=UPI001C11EB7E|nr:response regulator [Paenibacillus sp. MSJ-34]MBU5445437.1 response regulator [Paenibacillus sp. MSJ-34]